MLLSDDKAYFNNELISLLKLKKYHEIIRMFEATNPCDLVDLYGKTLLHLAVEYGNIAIMEHLIALGANVDAQDKQGATPLMIAIKKGRVKSIVSLLRANANIYTTDVNGKRQLLSLIFRFAVKMPLYIVKLFFERVQVENWQDFRNITNELTRLNCPLYCVALLSNTSIFKFMLDRGLPMSDGCVYTGNTVLHVAVQLARVDLVKLLIERDVDVNMTNKAGESALMMYPAAPSNDNFDMVKVLLTRETRLTSCSVHGKMQIYTALKCGTRHVVREVLQRLTDLGVKDSLGQTPLHYLMENDNADVIGELKERTFDVNALDNFGKSALHLAAERAIATNVGYLLRIGADVNVSRGDATPLFSALTSATNPNVPYQKAKRCVELLLRNGADIQFVSSDRDTTIFDIVLKENVVSDHVSVNSGRGGGLHAIKPILAYLALLESRGTTVVSELTLAKIKSNERMKSYFEFCRRQLRQMKTIVAPSLSAIFFKCLADSEEKIARLARDRLLAVKLLRAIRMLPRKTNYSMKLRKSLVNTLRITKLKKQAIPNLCKIKYLCCNRVVLDKIISYMNEHDLRIFNQI